LQRVVSRAAGIDAASFHFGSTKWMWVFQKPAQTEASFGAQDTGIFRDGNVPSNRDNLIALN
jgi:hypothetical protein